MLHAGADLTQNQGRDEVADSGEDGRQRQGGAGTKLGGEPVGGHLQAAHRGGVQRADERQPGVGQPELHLPDGQQRVERVGVAVVQPEASLAFDQVSLAAEACGRPGVRRLLRVNAPTTLAMRWLIPRLDRFHAQQPEVEVAVTTATTVPDELRGGFDLAIQRGVTEASLWSQYRAVPFLGEMDTLIVSPALHERQPLRRPSDVAKHVFLSSETRPGDRTDWLERAGVAPRPGQARRIFDHFFVTRQAVIDGIGIGVGPLPVLQSDLNAGCLLTPFPMITVACTGYVALLPFDADKTSPPGSLSGLAGRGRCETVMVQPIQRTAE